MLSSKANAALTRLKEIEEKYKTMRKQQKWNREEDSSISSISLDLLENLSANLNVSPKNVSKVKLNVKMPNTRFGNERASASSRTNSRSPADAVNADLEAATPSKDKSHEDKRESTNSDMTTIQENSSIDGASVGTASWSARSTFLRAKTLRQDTQAAASGKLLGREGRTKAAVKIEKGRIADKSSEISRGRTSLDSSSTAKSRSRAVKKSNDSSKSGVDLKSREHPLKTEANARRPETPNFGQQSRHSSHAGSLSDNSVIEESIDTIVDGSEIISELSRNDESVKVKDSTNDSQNSGQLEAEDATIMESSRQPLVAENGYANDTFEDVSSSTMRSGSKFQNSEQHSNERNSENLRDEKVADSLAPRSSATEMDLESASYASDLERIDANPDSITAHVIKSSNSTDSHLAEERGPEQAELEKKNVSSTMGKNVVDRSSNSEMTKTNTMAVYREKNSPPIAAARFDQSQENDQESPRKTSDETERHTDIPESSTDSKNKDALDESTEKRIFQDAEDALRKLHKDVIDALAKRQSGSKTARETPEGKARLEVRGGNATKITAADEIHRLTEKNRKLEHNREDSNAKKRKMRSKVKLNTKSVKARGSRGSRKEDSFDGKQMRALRKRIAELKLRQERENLQKYLQELKDLRMESSSTQRESHFTPLEFPKIAEFTSDVTDLEPRSNNCTILQEKVFAIRRWLKDQYVLYRDYCTIAQAINAHYVPTTLEDAKKMTHKPRSTTVKTG